MAKILSERERKLQKKLIPLNIFVCIIALVAAVTLFFMPILKVDTGKIIRHPDMVKFVEDAMDKQIGSDIEGTEQEGIDFKPVVSKIVKEVLSTADGALSVSAFGASKIAFAAEEEKTTAVMDELFFGEKALVTKLIDSVVSGVAGIFKEPEGKELIEQTVVSAIASSISKEMDTDILTDKNVKDITDTFREELEAVNANGGDVSPMVKKLATQVEGLMDEDFKFTEEEIASITEEIQQIYDDTVAHLEPGKQVDMEAIICVAVSSNVDLADFDLDKILDEMLNGSSEGGENGEEQEGKQGSDLAVAEGEVTPPPEEEAPKEIVTTYEGLLKQMNFDEEGLKVKLKTNLTKLVDDMLKEQGVDEYVGYYGYLFYGWLAFIAPWLILFLFAFFHMLAKNKRFTMWYVKLYSFLPCLIFWVAPLVAPKVIDIVAPEIMQEETGALIPAVLSGVSSFTFISGICYVLLWLVSIFWAFPIKHKIRKERKACKRAKKNGTYSYYSEEPVSGKKGKKAKKGGARPAQDVGAYGDNYGGYGDTYGGYGSSDGAYGSGYDSGYGDTYGGFDEPYDGYDSGFDTGFDDYDDYSSGSYGGFGYDDDDDLF